MKMINVYVSGRYESQVNIIKNKINTNPKLNWKLTNELQLAELLLFFDYKDINLSSSKGKKILIRQEPKFVLPQNYLKNNLKKFDQVINVGVPLKENPMGINWPQKIVFPEKNKHRISNSRVVMINSDLLSLKKDEKYSLRRKVAFKSEQVDLYGFGWNSSLISKLKTVAVELNKFFKNPFIIRPSRLKYYFKKQPNYFGAVSNKISIMNNYRISLVIENSSSYVSEKIFDSFSGGCIPIFVGPNLAHYKIPENLYVQANPTLTCIQSAIKLAQQMDYITWLDSLVNWYKSDECVKNWSEQTFLVRLKNLIE